MKFFTRRFICGGLPQRNRLAAVANYRKHLKALKLPPDLAFMAELNLHDARFIGVQRNKRDREYAFDLLTGDAQKGYALARITFHQASITDSTRRLLVRWTRHWEILASELHALRDGYSFHLLLWPRREVVIRFKTIDCSLKPVNKLIATLLRSPPGLHEAMRLALRSRSPDDVLSLRPAFIL